MRALTPLMFQVAIFMRHSDAVKRKARSLPGFLMRLRVAQSEKLVPQPQEATALGFLIWNDWPIRSSTKSITEPPI